MIQMITLAMETRLSDYMPTSNVKPSVSVDSRMTQCK